MAVIRMSYEIRPKLNGLLTSMEITIFAEIEAKGYNLLYGIIRTK